MSNIIIVDDHEIFRNGLVAVLNQINEINVVASLNNGKELLEALPDHDPDLILLDINMPEINGIEASTIALKQNPNLNILILSMYDDTEFYDSLIDIGVKGFILKDSNFDELKTAIEKVIKGENYFSQSLMLKLLRTKRENPDIECTDRELDILKLLALGYSTEEISEELNTSIRTIDRHKSNLFLKTKTNNSLKLLVFAIRNGLVSVS